MRLLPKKQFLPRPVRIMRGMIGLGIAVSMAALLVSLGVASGFEKEFKKALLGFNAHVTIYPDPYFSLKPQEIEAAWKKIGLSPETLVEIKPYLYREALLVHQGVIKGVVLKGIPMNTHNGVILGAALARKMGVGTTENGERKTENRERRTEDGERMIKILIPGAKGESLQKTIRLKVAGTFRSGLYELDEQFVLLDLNYLQKLFGVSSAVKGYELKLSDPDLAPLAAERLAQQFPHLSIQDWTDLNRPLLEAFQLEKWFFKILLGFMVLVSILNLMAAILLSIFRQKKKISILRALGLSALQIRRLFCLEGIGLGMKGVLMGLGFGLGLMFLVRETGWVPLDAEIYFLEKLPIDFVWFDVLMLLFLIGCGVALTSWWAAGRTAAVSIREGLHEP